ncbi:uncharacterized protein LOC123430944 [Hordeum vulgare subsp. vulgare]|nr:uncharacterized protein LOC123430944 [Hordeum vulgare subsp. vulgare]
MTLLTTVGRPPAPSSEITHRAHPEHKLTLEPTGLAEFKCNGCHELGTGAERYTCRQCDFDLHKDCALAQPTFEHKLLPGSTFGLCFEAPRTKHKQMCSACGGYVLGLHYHSNYLYLHPCCAKLPLEIQLGDQLTFELRTQVSHCCTKCRKGGGVRDFWFYRSTCKTVYLHVRCVIEDFLTPSSSSSTDGNSSLACYVKETTLQKHRSGKAERNFDPIFEIVKALASIIIAVLTGNPAPAILAAFDLGSNVIKSLRTR